MWSNLMRTEENFINVETSKIQSRNAKRWTSSHTNARAKWSWRIRSAFSFQAVLDTIWERSTRDVWIPGFEGKLGRVQGLSIPLSWIATWRMSKRGIVDEGKKWVPGKCSRPWKICLYSPTCTIQSSSTYRSLRSFWAVEWASDRYNDPRFRDLVSVFVVAQALKVMLPSYYCPYLLQEIWLLDFFAIKTPPGT